MLIAIFLFMMFSFKKHGTSGEGQSVYACRTFLGRLVENFLTDTDKGKNPKTRLS